VLANLTEFGKTPLFTLDELRPTGVAMVLYPLGASRAAAAASLSVYSTIRRDGTQRSAVAQMQTRSDLYAVLGYDATAPSPPPIVTEPAHPKSTPSPR
jgi:methylisocitrate lyase